MKFDQTLISEHPGLIPGKNHIKKEGVNHYAFKDAIYNSLIKLADYRFARKILIKQIENTLYNALIETKKEDLWSVKQKKYDFLMAMLNSSLRNIEKGYFSISSFKRLLKIFVGYSFLKPQASQKTAISAFTRQYGMAPPTFVVISPTQKCNLNCTGCYALSDSHCKSTLSFQVFDRMMHEIHDNFGIRFVTISGGEPFLFRDGKKSILDIFEKYQDIFFLVYTNGTLLTSEIAGKLKDLGNVTPAISVEGYRDETDERRGKNIYERILRGFENLRQAGIPFGISVTATNKNVSILLDDAFYDFYFNRLGATYMWQFQLMPIGKAKDCMTNMVSPSDRVKLFRKWEYLVHQKKYCVADFWNSGLLSNGCIAYGRKGGYFYVDWDGNITPCVFIPYSDNNIYDLYKNGKSLTDALFSDFMKNGRQWQCNYGLKNLRKPCNWLMPCSIRDHYDNFRKNILPRGIKSINRQADESLSDAGYYNKLIDYDHQLNLRTADVWEKEYIDRDYN